MSVVNITTSGMSIEPYKKKQCPALEKMTSMRDFACKFKRIETTGYILDDRFVTYHLSRFLIENYFPDYEVKFIPANPYEFILDENSFEIDTNIELRPDQIYVVNAILNDLKHSRWFIHCIQSFGKTLVSIYIMTQFKIKTLIMCYSTEILSQWQNRLYEDTNMNMDRILRLDEGNLITQILDDLYPVGDYDIFLATPKILTGYAKSHGWNKLNELFKKLKIGMKIYDEAHRNIANMIKIDALTSVKYTLYLSGDFAQASKYKTYLFHQMFADVVKIEPSEDYSDNMRYTQAVVVEYNTHPSELEKLQIHTRRGMSVWKYMKYQIEKGKLIEVLDYILDHIISLGEKDRRILVLTSMIEHCEYMYEHIKNRYAQYTVGLYHGNLDAVTQEDTKNNAQIIVATYSSFSTGMDTKYIKYVISTSASNRIEDNQASGRARKISDDEDVFFWMLIDKGFENIANKEEDRIAYLYKLKVKRVMKLEYE